MPIIHVNLVAGRSSEIKQALAKRLTEAAVETLNISPEKVRIFLHELEREDCFVGGRSLGSSEAIAPNSNEPEASYQT
jgi:4-oxalocrotonate tautomerase